MGTSLISRMSLYILVGAWKRGMSPFLRQPVFEGSQVAEVGVVVVPELELCFDGGRLDRNSRAWNLCAQALIQLSQWVHRDALDICKNDRGGLLTRDDRRATESCQDASGLTI